MLELFNYSEVWLARNSNYFNINKGIYFWYYPIHIKYEGLSIKASIDQFFEDGIDQYSSCTKVELHDTQKKIQFELRNMGSSVSEIISLPRDDVNEKKKIAELLKGLSIFTKPLYIGKASGESGVSGRLKQHLEGRSTFGQELKRKLNDTDLNIGEMIILAIDLEEVMSENNIKNTGGDFAKFVESILLGIFKPIYNQDV